MKKIFKILPWAFLALFACEIIGILLPKKDGEFHVRDFGRLPVLLNGRVQPFDSVAHNALLQIRSTGDIPLEDIPWYEFWRHAEKLKSTPWLLELMCRPEKADDRLVFMINHPELLGELGLGEKDAPHEGVRFKSGLRYYSFNELKPVLPDIREQNNQALAIEDSLRTPLQRQVLKLGNAISLYQHLKVSLRPEGSDDFAADLQSVQAAIAPGVAAVEAKDLGKPFDQPAYDRILQIASAFRELQRDPAAGSSYPLVIPPVHPGLNPDDWGNAGYGVMESIRARELFPPLVWLAAAANAYRDQDAAKFNEAVADYTQWLDRAMPRELGKGRAEFFYNDLKLFLHAIIIYIFAFILTVGSLLTFGLFRNLSESLRRSAYYLILLAGTVHTAGLVFRMMLEGRPPVTNLYSSAIFIGWGAMVLGVILEKIYQIGIGNAVASLAGFVTLLIAQNLAVGGDTMEMMRAVLDNNFWLATHVVVVTLGYASTFAAGLLAILYVLLGLFTPVLAQKISASPGAAPAKSSGHQMDVGKALVKMTYGIICFATLFSFVGTVLGGIWADQSWGRFWGWDPKENGALVIVLWNAIILHARWGGMVRERGLMNMAIFGNIVTSFSWFGVNLLGIGLHSYGFTDSGFERLRLFVILQLFLIALGLIPKRFWRSFREPDGIPPAPGSTGGKPAPVAS